MVAHKKYIVALPTPIWAETQDEKISLEHAKPKTAPRNAHNQFRILGASLNLFS